MIAVQVKAGSEEYKAVEKNLQATQSGVNSVVKVNIYTDCHMYSFGQS